MRNQRITAFAMMSGRAWRAGCCVLAALATIGPLPVAAQTTGSAASQEVTSTRERKVALVIGNGAYENAPLKNPVNDARAVAKLLRELGFEVLLRENVTETVFLEAVRNFGGRLRPGGVNLFYFAGHGMQVGGRNYLVPVGASIENEDEVPFRAIDANQVLDKMSRANGTLNLVILDACRNNPFNRSFRAQINGLAHMEAPSGTLIAFATSPGSVAADGEGANSTYTKNLLANIASPGVPVEIALKRVRESVSRETQGRQIPWESSSVMGDFYFRPGEAEAMVALAETAETRLATEKIFWESIQAKGGTEEYLAYLRQYPNGRFATLARARLNAEQAKQAAASANSGDSAYELTYWDSIRNSSNPAEYKAYLEQFPKGRFAVLARGRLTTLEPQVAAARSTTLGTAGVRRDMPKIGDTWTYEVYDRGRKADTLTVLITGVSAEGMVTEKLARARFPTFTASRTFGPEFNPHAYQEIDTPGGMYLAEFAPYVSPDAAMIGKSWEVTPSLTAGPETGSIRREVWDMKLEVVGSERIRVPAGEFMTIKVQGSTALNRYQITFAGLKLTYWYAPKVKRTVRFVRELTTGIAGRQEDVYELASFKVQP